MSDHRTPDVFDMIADVVRAREAPWRQQAACRSGGKLTETFYPSQASGPGSSHPAKAICRTCEVQVECEQEWESMPGPMRNHGVWFGTVERERRKLRADAVRVLSLDDFIEEIIPSTCTDLLPSYTLLVFTRVGSREAQAAGSKPAYGGSIPPWPSREDQAITGDQDDHLIRSGAPGPGG